MKIILASASPRRKQLLSMITKDFEVIVSNSNETFEQGLSLEEQSKKVAYIKAKTVFDKTKGDRIVIGSDTIVVKNGKIYGKPKDNKEAFKMISELENDVHEVMTSLCILIEENGEQKEYTDCTTSKVFISKMSDKEKQEWIDTGKAIDKAGAYAIQEEFSKYIEKMEGNYDAIVGLPTHKVYEILKNYI